MRQLLVTAVCTIGAATLMNAGHLRSQLLVSAKLDGMQEVPSVNTNALGVAGFTLNDTRDSLCVNITWTGLTGPVTGIHIHEGARGANGGVVTDLTPYINGNRISVVLTGADVSMNNVSKLLSGMFYLNIHTALNPNGEIRGQLELETDWTYTSVLDGAQEVPSVNTAAYGTGFFMVSKDLSVIRYNVVVQDLSGAISGAHLHYGAAGTNGGVAEDLSPMVNGNVISGMISNPSAMLLDSMMMGKVYLNVHTANNPSGEIRGQLMTNMRYIYFDASLDGMQEVPMVNTNAKGTAAFKLNTTMDTLWYDIVATDLSGAIGGIHLHNAPINMNGGVEVDLTPSVMGNRVMGMITGSTLTTTLINKMLTGDIYINIHTAANANGEIRGQVYRAAREGYNINLDGMQEVPAVTTLATGSGVVSVDRNQSNAHVMIVANGITPNGAHFHNAVMGQNGPVIFDLTPWWMNGGAFGYWKSSDTPPFNVANSVKFRNDSVYVNLHTTLNPNGEIRGQVLRGFSCGMLTTGVEDMNATNTINVFPNPTSDVLNITFSSGSADRVVEVVDVTGRVVYSTNVQGTENRISILVNGWTKGLYLVRVIENNEVFVQKCVVE